MLTLKTGPLIAEQYADMLALNFRLRKVLLTSHHYTMNDLFRFDRRIQAGLEGMTLLQTEISDYLHDQLNDILTLGDLFRVALFATCANDEFLLSGCMGLVQAVPHLLPALCAVINWMPAQSRLWPQIQSLPACRAYMTATRHDKSVSAEAFSQQDILVLTEQGYYMDFLLVFLYKNSSPLFIPALESVFSSNKEELILQGCHVVLCLNSLPDEYVHIATNHLLKMAYSKKKDISEVAIKYLLTCQPAASRYLINDLSTDGADTRLLIKAQAWSGLIEHIPSLMDYFDSPEYARLSALSVIAITGSSPERDDWQKNKIEESSSIVFPDPSFIPEQDPEQRISWPERAGFEHWWHTHRNSFAPEIPHLYGQLTTRQGLEIVLKQAPLNLRPLALLRMGEFSELATTPAWRQI